jgi:hypothetical protein
LETTVQDGREDLTVLDGVPGATAVFEEVAFWTRETHVFEGVVLKTVVLLRKGALESVVQEEAFGASLALVEVLPEVETVLGSMWSADSSLEEEAVVALFA